MTPPPPRPSSAPHPCPLPLIPLVPLLVRRHSKLLDTSPSDVMGFARPRLLTTHSRPSIPLTSRSTPRQSDVPARDIHSFGLVAVYGIIDFVFVCFSFVLFLCLVSSLFSLAPPSSPLPSDSEHHRSFLLRARFRIATTIYFFAFNLDTDHFPHTTPSNLSPAGHSLFDLSLSFSPLFPLSP